MDAMILSAGLGTRMRPLTHTLPKPLIEIGKFRLIEYHLVNLKKAGVNRVIVNRSYLARKFSEFIGSGSKFDLEIVYSDEGEVPLETGGGIVRALPLIESDSFIVVSADIWCDYNFSDLLMLDADKSCLVLVSNPHHHPNGDFVLSDGRVDLPTNLKTSPTMTYSGIGRLRKDMFACARESVFPLNQLFKSAIELRQLWGTVHTGIWFDVGTMKRLEEVEAYLKNT